MLNEHERDEGPEDGEYHFSDEGGYDTNHDHEEETKAPEIISEQNNLAAKFSSYRRFVIIGGVFAVVLLITYLIIPPLATAPSTEITAVSASPTVSAEAPARIAVISKPAPVVASVPKPITETKLAKEAPKPAQAEAPAVSKPSGFASLIEAEKEKLIAEKEAVMAKVRNQGAQSQESKSAESSTVITVPPPEEAALPAAPPAIGSQDFINEPVSTMMSSSQQESQAVAETKANLDRLTAMQEANTKALGQIQAQYAQKVADYDVQNKALQEQVQTLTTRLSSMEAQISKLTQTLNQQQQQMSPPPSSGEAAMSSASENGLNLQNPPILGNAQPGFKSGYSVQAIIPGRAWLRTDGGETITVAEGDVLKSLGKVTKIDPYDGTIQVDTGSRVITLTYGNGEYS